MFRIKRKHRRASRHLLVFPRDIAARGKKGWNNDSVVSYREMRFWYCNSIAASPCGGSRNTSVSEWSKRKWAWSTDADLSEINMPGEAGEREIPPCRLRPPRRTQTRGGGGG